MSLQHFTNRPGVNFDCTFRCPLMCPKCQRQRFYTHLNKKVPGDDVSIQNFKKIINFFKNVHFEGQYSDSVHHPKFIEMLKMCKVNNNEVRVQHSSAAKPIKWYKEAFEANKKVEWRFSMDGLPESSHQYRINQNGKKLFEIMKMAVNILEKKPFWQFIVFKYNENEINEAIELADKIGINFYTLQSSKWDGEDDPYRPSDKWMLK